MKPKHGILSTFCIGKSKGILKSLSGVGKSGNCKQPDNWGELGEDCIGMSRDSPYWCEGY